MQLDLLRRLKSPDSQSHQAAFGASHFAATSTSEAPCAVTACPSAKQSFRIPRSRMFIAALVSAQPGCESLCGDVVVGIHDHDHTIGGKIGRATSHPHVPTDSSLRTHA